MAWVYDHPHPAIAADVAVFAPAGPGLELLLIRRAAPPFEGRWALPGGFVGIDEDLEAGARRELFEETGLEPDQLEQLGAFGRPDRDPRERVVSIAFVALLAAPDPTVAGASDVAAAGWHDAARLPPLAFDHAAIVDAAIGRLAERLGEVPLAAPRLLRGVDGAALGAALRSCLRRRS